MTSSTDRNDSPAGAFVAAFRQVSPELAPRLIKTAWRKLSIQDRAAITADWSFWCRVKQSAPVNDWKTWGFLTGRGFGKTIAISKYINDEIQAGNATLICLAAQDEQSAVDIQVAGPSGLIATAPPWFRPKWEATGLQVVWPNGARAYVRTPEVPGKIRGLEYHLAWISELQSWPNSTREEAFDNVFLSTRLGYARVCWDATPKRRHPLLKALLTRHAADPSLHHVVRGTTHENAANLGKGYVSELERRFAGTLRGREELLGEILDESEFSLVKQIWIDESRRPEPSQLKYSAVSIDPAVSDRKGSDTTGLIYAGLGYDGQGYVFANATGKYQPDKWCGIALDWYVDRRVDVLIAETNKGGALVTQQVRSLGQTRGLETIVIGKDERPRHQPGKVFVKEVYARGAKQERAEPVATAYERRRISHVIGADLESLENTLTTWEPKQGEDSPGDLDALVHAMVELLGLNKNELDPAVAFRGIGEVAKQISSTQPRPMNLATVFSSALAGTEDRI
jgi:phage terminase large subunit-like protein